MKNTILLVIKGFIMGIANIIPGVSGGTLALTLGIYEDFIGAISHFFSKIKENIKFLAPIGIGIVLSLLTMSSVIDSSFKNYPIPTMLFFMGLVIGGVPLILKNIKGTKEVKMPTSYLIGLITFLIVMTLAFSEELFGSGLVNADFSSLSVSGYLMLFAVGVIAAATMIIPGVSGSLVLMLLGYYFPVVGVLKEITHFKNINPNIFIIMVFGIGVLIGIVVIAKIIEYLLKKYLHKTYFGVLGFILASIIAIPVSVYHEVANISFDFLQIVIGILFLIIGCLIGYKLGDE